MEAKKNVPVNKNSTVETITANDPAIFNGMISALEGLTDVTDKGIERVINAVNGLSKATTATSDPDEVQAATSKALARALESSERIETIEIKEEPLTATEQTKVTPKAESINIGKALSGFKPNKADFYQPNDSGNKSVTNESNNLVSNDNRATSTQNQTNTSTVNNAAGGRETVFNQLNSIETTQLNTHEKVNAIDSKLDNSTTSTTSVNSSEQHNNTKAPRSVKSNSVGAPTFDRSHIATSTSNNSEKAARIESEKTRRESTYSAREKTNNNNTENNTKTGSTKTTSEVKTNNNSRSSASDIAESRRIDRVEVSLRDNATALTTSAQSSKESLTQTASKLVSATESVTDLTESVKSQAQSSSKQTTNNNTNSATVSSAKSENTNNQAKYYRDKNNRLRTGSGRYASKEETAKHEQSQKSNGYRPVKSRIGKHLKNRSGRQVLGSAFLGSAYPALEEAYQASQSAKFAAQSRGLTSVDGFKKYAAKKGKIYSKKATDTAQGTKDVYSSVKGGTSNVFSKIKSSIFKNSTNSNSSNDATNSNSASVSRATDNTSNNESTTNAINSEASTVSNTTGGIVSIDDSASQTNTTGSNSSTTANSSTATNSSITANSSTVGNSSTTASNSTAGSNSEVVKNSTAGGSSKVTNSAETINKSANSQSSATSNKSGDSKTATRTATANNTAITNNATNKSALSSVNVDQANSSTKQTSSDAKQLTSNTSNAINDIDNSSKAVNSNKVNGLQSTTKAPAIKPNPTAKHKPSTVDGVVKSPATKVINAGGTGVKGNKSIEKYLTNNVSKSNKASNSTNSKQPLTNSVFIGAQKSTDGLTKKLSKEYHDAHMLKVDKLIKTIEDMPAGGGGSGGGGSIIDDALDFDRDRKDRKRNKQNRKAKPKGKFGRIKEFLKAGRFFGGGAKVAGAIGAGAIGVGAAAAGSGAAATAAPAATKVGAAPATKAAGKAGSMAGGLGKLAGGGLAGTARLVSKAIPLLAIASTAYDAYDGFTNKEKQQETFNLKSTEEANLGQKSAMAAGSVLDLGGLTSGAAGLLGDGLGALGFEGAKEALTFDAGDIAKTIYDKGETLVNSGAGVATSLGEGDFSGAASNALTFLQTALPTFGMFSDFSEDKEKSDKTEKTDKTKESSTTEKTDKTTSIEKTQGGDVSTVKTESDKSSLTDKSQNITATSEISSTDIESNGEPKTKKFSNSVQKKIDAHRKRQAERKAALNGDTLNASQVVNNSTSIQSIDDSVSTGDNSTSNKTSNLSPRAQSRIDEQKKKMLEFRAASQPIANGAEQVNAISNTDTISPIAKASQITPVQSEFVTKRESVTDVSTLANKSSTTNTSNSTQGGNSNSGNGEPIIITENAKTIAALKEISKKLDLNRKTDKSNNGASSAGINSMPTNIPANFSDPFMERLANE